MCCVYVYVRLRVRFWPIGWWCVCVFMCVCVCVCGQPTGRKPSLHLARICTASESLLLSSSDEKLNEE